MKLYFMIISLLMCVAGVQAQDTLRIWVKSFIPNKHPDDPNYVKPVPGRAGMWMIPGPGSSTVFYATDHRQFSADPNASARLTTEFEIVMSGDAAKVQKVDGREIMRCGPTEQLDSITGKTLETRTAKPAVPLTGESFGIGGPHVADSQVQVIFQSAARNPFAPPAISPAIDYSLDITFDKNIGTVKFQGTIGRFPAYEAYVSFNGEPAKELFKEAPSGATPWSLYDFGSGIGNRNVSGAIRVIESKLEGTWKGGQNYPSHPNKPFPMTAVFEKKNNTYTGEVIVTFIGPPAPLRDAAERINLAENGNISFFAHNNGLFRGKLVGNKIRGDLVDEKNNAKVYATFELTRQ